MLPPTPPWDGLHPLVIHFPIALLLVAPLFVALGAIFTPGRWGFPLAALLLMALGTIAAYVAVSTGEATAQYVERSEAIDPVLHAHQRFAEQTRTAFSVLTLVYAGVLFIPLLLKKELGRRPALALNGIFLAAYMGASLLVVNTGHLGGRLVHEFGVVSMYSEESARQADLPEDTAESAQYASTTEAGG